MRQLFQEIKESALGQATQYELSQWFWYRTGKQEDYIRTHVRPDTSSRILDIGCGSGNLAPLLSYSRYVGFDLNPSYVRHAQERGLANTEFYVADVHTHDAVQDESFDIVMANGILHHLDDPSCTKLLQLARRALRPGGRLVTRDGCFLPGQRRIERWLLENDRGRFVRTPEAYDQLIERHFPNRTHVIRKDLLRTPYSMIIFSGSKE